jgi:hypothetical protein
MSGVYFGHMKKIFLFFAIFVVAGILYTPRSIFAVSELQEPVATPAATRIEYALPYPGMLSDNPLYFFKKFRDQILEKLISDPVRKVEFYVLQSDKAVNAGIFLNTKGKMEASGESLAQSGDYMEKAIKAVGVFKSQNKEVPSYIIERLTNSLVKHEEVLRDLMTKNEKAGSVLEIVKKQQEVVAGLKLMN